MELAEQFGQVCNAYIEAFCHKHLDCDTSDCEIFWVHDEVGGILVLNDYFINFLDLKYDIDKDVEKDKFFAWYDYSLRVKEAVDYDINYQSYLMGYRVSNLDRIEALKKEVFDLVKQTQNETSIANSSSLEAGTRS